MAFGIERVLVPTISMSLLSRNTPYSKRYVSTPFEKRGKLPGSILKPPFNAASRRDATYFLGPTIAEMPSLIMLRLPTHVTG